MKNGKKYAIHQSDVEKIKSKIEELESQLRINNLQKNDAYTASTGQLADSPEYENVLLSEQIIMSEIEFQKNLLAKTEVMNDEQTAKLANLNKVITADIAYPNGEIEELVFKVVTMTSKAYFTGDELQEVSLNSPIGSVIINSQIGDVCTYSVGENKFSLLVKNIQTLENYNDGKSMHR